MRLAQAKIDEAAAIERQEKENEKMERELMRLEELNQREFKKIQDKQKREHEKEVIRLKYEEEKRLKMEEK